MKMIFKRFCINRLLYVCLLCLFIAGCAGLQDEVARQPFVETESGKRFVLWMLSDIQPRDEAERIHFARTIDDSNSISFPIDVGLICGDLLKSGSKDEDYKWFLDTREQSKVRYWYELAGNHDVRSKKYFQKYFPIPEYYGVLIGNILILVLSDTSVESHSVISDEAFFWWRDQVITNQDKILITLSHAQLSESGLAGSSLESRTIKRSQRFEEVLRKYRVAIWASGHTHLPPTMSGTVAMRKPLGNTLFVNVSPIREELLIDSHSRFFYFYVDSNILWIRSRNHKQKVFVEGLDFPIILKKKFQWDGSSPRLVQ